MKILSTITVLLLGFSLCHAETRKLQMSLDDEYTVQNTEKWTVSVQRYMTLRLADVRVLPKQKKTFSLMLYFKCDTKDLAQFDTPEKMKKYLGGTVEKEIQVEEIKNKGWYGFKTRLTDASLVGKKTMPEGQFLYIIRGMIRLSEDSALGFSLMTNDPSSEETREIEKYIYGFAKERKPSQTRCNEPGDSALVDNRGSVAPGR